MTLPVTLSKSNVDLLYQALEQHDIEKAQQLVIDIHPAEIALVLESLPAKQRELLWQVVKAEQGQILPHITDIVRAELIQTMQLNDVVTATQNMDTDDAVDVLQDLSDDMAAQVLQVMEAQPRERLTQVLFYPEDTAGGLMNIDMLTIRADVTLKTVLRYLRRLQTLPDKTDMLMVIDRNNRYQGVLILTDILTNKAKCTVGEIMKTEIKAVPATLSTHEVARLFEKHDLVSAPVVDEKGMLVGRITVDDVMDVLRSEADHNLMGQAGLDEEDDMFAPVLMTTRNRAIWLGINLGTAFLAAWVIGLFEATLEKVVALAVLMPIVASMGGIAGTQTLTIMIRGMAVDQVTESNTPWLLRRELAVGFLNGLLWAVVVAGIAILWFKSIQLGLIIGSAIIINLFFAALAGMLVPLILKRLAIDPALAGGVILTTITDVIGFAAFLGLATLVLTTQ